MSRRRPRIPCIGWPGPCAVHGQFHGCKLADRHLRRHICDCGTTLKQARQRAA